MNWLARIYDNLADFVEWWRENRSDKEGFFHCKCSWEAGQDCSIRFNSSNCGDVTDYIRTIDTQAATTHAMQILANFAQVLGKPQQQKYWQTLAQQSLAQTQSMFYDRWYRDWDSRSQPAKPIIIPNYLDAMQLSPVSLGLSTADQNQFVKTKLQTF